jgi:hypothetical protein
MEDARSDYLKSTAGEEIYIPIRNQFLHPGVSRRLGDWDARFFGSEMLVADDNIFLTDEDRVSDLIAVTTLGAHLAREGAAAAAEITGAVTVENYLRNPSQDAVEGYGRLGAQWGMRKGFLRVLDEAVRRQDAIQFATPGAGGSSLPVLGADRTSQFSNEAQLALGFHDDVTAAEVRYGNSYWNYGQGVDALDAVQHAGMLILRWRYSPKLEWNATGEYRDLRYLERVQNDYTARAGYLGFRWALSPKTVAWVKAGYMGQDVRPTGTIGDDEAFHGPVGALGTEWEASAKLKVDAQYSRDIYPTLGSNFQDTHLLGSTVHWQASPLWSILARGTLQQSRASFTDERARYYTLLFRIGYRPSDRVEIALQYDYRARRSPLAAGGYDDNRLGLQISFGF